MVMQGRTPLHIAASMESAETLRLLLCHGADLTAPDCQVGCMAAWPHMFVAGVFYGQH